MSQIYDILSALGYRLRDEGQFYRTAALYRGGTNQSCMVVRKDNGSFKDFKTGRKGSFRQLVAMTAGDEAEDILKDYDPDAISYAEPTIEIPKKFLFDRSVLTKLLPQWDMYLEDGLSEETMREFEVGLKTENHLFNRYCFPIYNEFGGIIGFAGRHYTKQVPDGLPKWKLRGKKTDWLWPLHLNALEIAEADEVILVESPNCVFHLWEAGIKNALCLFGTEMSPKVFNYLIKQSPKRIIIATNNDSDANGYAGQEGAAVIQGILAGFFGQRRLLVHLPFKKDFGEMSREEILFWKDAIPQDYGS